MIGSASYAVTALVLVLISISAQADYLRHLGSNYEGRLVRGTSTEVVLEIACDPTRLINFDKASITYIEFDPACGGGTEPPVAATSAVTCATPLSGFKAVVAGLSTEPFVKSFDLASFTTVLLRYHDESILVVDRGKLRRISAAVRCEMDPPHHAPGTFLAGVCYEPRAWAVAFTGAPVSRNQIFTQGFSIYVSGGDQRDGEAPDVREAFGHALTLWTAALQRIRSELAPELASFIDRSVSRSETGRYTLLTPPQAVRRHCKETAMFEVRRVTSRGRAFPEEDRHTLAKAQFEGRTVLVNAIDYSYSLDLQAVRSADGKHSLVSIMTHELGHAFGLRHDDVSVASIMSSRASTMSKEPTDEDARQLARVLLEEIRGRAPGEVSFAACVGLSAN